MAEKRIRSGVITDVRRYHGYDHGIYKPYVAEIMYEEDTFRMIIPFNLKYALWYGEQVLFQEADGVKLKGDIPFWGIEWMDKVWAGRRWRLLPLWSRDYEITRKSLLGGSYSLRFTVREAWSWKDFESILYLEQYHYADRESELGKWRCPSGHEYFGNTRHCPECGKLSRFLSLRGSGELNARYLVAVDDESNIIGFTKILAMRQVGAKIGSTKIVGALKILVSEEEVGASATYGDMRDYGRRAIRIWRGRHAFRDYISTRIVRMMRAVVHPELRAEGIGKHLMYALEEWVKERAVPDQRLKKWFVMTLARMAKYNPFLERAGWTFLFTTINGVPLLVKPVSPEGEERLKALLSHPVYGKIFGGRLYVDVELKSRGAEVEFKDVSVAYRRELDVSKLSREARKILEDYNFAVEKKLIEKPVFSGFTWRISRGEVVAVIGSSGSGKTSLVKAVLDAVGLVGFDSYTGEVLVRPGDVVVKAYVPGVVDVVDRDEEAIELILSAMRTPSSRLAVKLANMVGLGDVITYVSRFSELSAGQKERLRMAVMLAAEPDLVIVDEFAGMLDSRTAVMVARKFTALLKQSGITGILVVNRQELLSYMNVDKVIKIEYGRVKIYDGKDILLGSKLK